MTRADVTAATCTPARESGRGAPGDGDTRSRRQAATRAALAGLLAALSLAASPAAEDPAFRWRAPIEVKQMAPFVQLSLPTAAYAHSEAAGLADLRVVDARGERVPFAWLDARAEARMDERRREARLYPLPARPAADGTWPAPVEIAIDRDRVQVRSGRTASRAPAASAAGARPGGWVVDLGERRADEPPPRWLRLRWSGPAEFTAGYGLESSDDLRTWRGASGGQLMALASPSSPSGPLTQPNVALPAAPGRYLRLVWADPAAAPMLVGAEGVVDERRRVTLDPPTEVVVEAMPGAADPAEQPPPPRGALTFDLGGSLPLVRVELRFASGTHVAPVRLQGRDRPGERWRELGQAVFYRLERNGAPTTSPPLEIGGSARFIRVVPDERAAALDARDTRLVADVQLGRLVFASQGTSPFALLAGAPQARPAALPLPTLVPDVAAERARFGTATLGTWEEEARVARRREAERREAQWRSRLLWAVLLAGVAVLGFMVWRLARSRPGESAPADPPAS